MSRVTVAVNGLSLVHQDSGGVSTATLPDVCITPPSNAPTPYPNVARSTDLANGSISVRADGGNSIALAGSTFARSTGGEPGAGGGIVSVASCSDARFLSHSFDVRVEGRGACRLTDKMLHNRGNTIDCAGVMQAQVVTRGRGPDFGHSNLPPGTPTEFGIDTNNSTLNVKHAKKKGAKFVGRYLSFNGTNPVLSGDEIERYHKAKLKIFCIWELTQYRAVEVGSISGELQAGIDDATQADAVLNSLYVPGKVIYFTVDWYATWPWWKTTVTDNVTGESTTNGDLVLAYFQGVNSVIGRHRTGAYGTFITLNKLFQHKLISYGWQQSFGKRGKRIEPKAQLWQFDITTDVTGWGVGGAGALDFDRAVKPDFGQW